MDRGTMAHVRAPKGPWDWCLFCAFTLNGPSDDGPITDFQQLNPN
jgi:hypothetical protein